MRRRHFAEAVAQVAGLRAPEVFKRDSAVGEEIDCVGGEGREAAGLEDDAHEVGHVGAVDDFVDRARADDERGRHAETWRAFGAVEEEVAREVEDDLDASGGQDALMTVSDRWSVRIPERADSAGEGRSGSVLKVKHSGFDGRYSTRVV